MTVTAYYHSLAENESLLNCRYYPVEEIVPNCRGYLLTWLMNTWVYWLDKRNLNVIAWSIAKKFALGIIWLKFGAMCPMKNFDKNMKNWNHSENLAIKTLKSARSQVIETDSEVHLTCAYLHYIHSVMYLQCTSFWDIWN